ncbi:MAG: hypothetical protein NVSMB29_05640 [Candidatus Dormibacteria bacterium]
MAEDADRPSAHRANLLLVDDRRENLMALEATLRPLAQNLVLAASGEEALRALLQDDFALILLDVRMPGMDGFETAAHIKRRSRTRHIPIIFLTAVDDDPGLVLRGYSEGAVDYLAKPFDPWVLRSKVSVFIELDAKTNLLRQQATELEQRNAELAAALELAEAGSRAKSSFLNLAGHELRTPLAVVYGYTSLVIEGAFGPVPEPMLKPLRTVEEKADELGNLVDGILTAARLEAGTMPVNTSRVNLGNAIQAAVERAEPRAALRQADLSAAAPEVPTSAEVDPDHLARILDNLIVNALTYSGERPVVRVSVEAGERPVVRVQDQGEGIPAGMEERIFERFVRGDPAGQGPPGTGLGLSVARELAERNGACLLLEPVPAGSGAVFSLSLRPSTGSGDL